MTIAAQISKSSTVTATKDLVSCDLVGEAVILHLTSGVYFGLNTIGARIWNLIQEPVMVDHLLHQLVTEYDVRLGHCESDLFALLQDLVANNLIVVEEAHRGAIAIPVPQGDHREIS